MTTDYQLPDWGNRVEVHTMWDTHISRSDYTEGETRNPLKGKPSRRVRASILAMDRQEVARVIAAFGRLTGYDYDLPLYPDQSIVTQDSSGTTLYCDTTYRRFEVGKNVVILPWNGGTFYDPVVHAISSKTATTITLTSGLAATVPAGSLVFPLLSMRQDMDESYTSLGPIAGRWALDLEEIYRTAYASNGTTPGSSYNGYYVWDKLPDLGQPVTIRGKRNGSAYQIGKTRRVVKPDYSECRWHVTATYRTFTRADFWSILQFFDWAEGRARAFYVPFPVDTWECVAINTTYFEVPDNFHAHSFYGNASAVCVVLNDGTIYIREVTSWVDVGDNLRISWSLSIGSVSLEDVAYVGLAMLARFGSDALVERWATDQVCDMTIEFVELPPYAEAVEEADRLVYQPDTIPILPSNW